MTKINHNIGNEKVVAEKRASRLKKTILTSALSFGIVLGSMQNVFCMQAIIADKQSHTNYASKNCYIRTQTLDPTQESQIKGLNGLFKCTVFHKVLRDEGIIGSEIEHIKVQDFIGNMGDVDLFFPTECEPYDRTLGIMHLYFSILTGTKPGDDWLSSLISAEAMEQIVLGKPLSVCDEHGTLLDFAEVWKAKNNVSTYVYYDYGKNNKPEDIDILEKGAFSPNCYIANIIVLIRHMVIVKDLLNADKIELEELAKNYVGREEKIAQKQKKNGKERGKIKQRKKKYLDILCSLKENIITDKNGFVYQDLKNYIPFWGSWKYPDGSGTIQDITTGAKGANLLELVSQRSFVEDMGVPLLYPLKYSPLSPTHTSPEDFKKRRQAFYKSRFYRMADMPKDETTDFDSLVREHYCQVQIPEPCKPSMESYLLDEIERISEANTKLVTIIQLKLAYKMAVEMSQQKQSSKWLHFSRVFRDDSLIELIEKENLSAQAAVAKLLSESLKKSRSEFYSRENELFTSRYELIRTLSWKMLSSDPIKAWMERAKQKGKIDLHFLNDQAECLKEAGLVTDQGLPDTYTAALIVTTLLLHDLRINKECPGKIEFEFVTGRGNSSKNSIGDLSPYQYMLENHPAISRELGDDIYHPKKKNSDEDNKGSFIVQLQQYQTETDMLEKIEEYKTAQEYINRIYTNIREIAKTAQK